MGGWEGGPLILGTPPRLPPPPLPPPPPPPPHPYTRLRPPGKEFTVQIKEGSLGGGVGGVYGEGGGH